MSTDGSIGSAKWTLYCDEAGNAGPNYWDRDQPFHVSAGFLVKPEAHAGLEAAISAGAAATQGSELKGSRLIKRRKGQKTILRVLRDLGAAGCRPFFIIAERRFCIAGKVVEVFMDPMTNPSAAWLPTTAVNERQAAWETVSELPDDVLKAFADAYREPSAAGFKVAARGLSAALRASGHPRLADSIAAAEHYTDAIMVQDVFGEDGRPHAIWTALNLPVFLHVVKKADRIMEFHRGHQLHVVHDEIRQFDAVLAEGVRLLQGPPGIPVDIFVDDRTLRVGLRHVSAFEVRSSSVTAGLQAADLLASTVARLVREVYIGSAWTPELRRLATTLLPALMYDDPPFAGVLAHRNTLGNILQPMFQRLDPSRAPQL